jgi:hypothetical protein
MEGRKLGVIGQELQELGRTRVSIEGRNNNPN